MCKAPKPPKPKDPEKVEFLHNPYLDAELGGSRLVSQMRQGRSSLRIDLASARVGVLPTEIAPPDRALPNHITQPRRGGGSRGTGIGLSERREQIR